MPIASVHNLNRCAAAAHASRAQHRVALRSRLPFAGKKEHPRSKPNATQGAPQRHQTKTDLACHGSCSHTTLARSWKLLCRSMVRVIRGSRERVRAAGGRVVAANCECIIGNCEARARVSHADTSRRSLRLSSSHLVQPATAVVFTQCSLVAVAATRVAIRRRQRRRLAFSRRVPRRVRGAALWRVH